MAMHPESPGSSPSVADLLIALSAAGVEFVICGGVACLLHGISRVTNDIDLAVELSEGNLRRFIETARLLRLQPRMPESLESLADPVKRDAWVQQKGAMVFTLVSTSSPLQVDIFLHYPVPWRELQANAERRSLGTATVLVSSREDLIRAKRVVQPQRETDRRDIEDLTRMIDHERKPGP